MHVTTLLTMSKKDNHTILIMASEYCRLSAMVWDNGTYEIVNGLGTLEERGFAQNMHMAIGICIEAMAEILASVA